MHAWIYLKSIVKWASLVGVIVAFLEWLEPFGELLHVERNLMWAMVFAYGIEFGMRIFRAIKDGWSCEEKTISGQLLSAVFDWLALLIATAIVLSFAAVLANGFVNGLHPVATFIRSTAFFGVFLLLGANALVLFFGSEGAAKTFVNRIIQFSEAGRSQELGQSLDNTSVDSDDS